MRQDNNFVLYKAEIFRSRSPILCYFLRILSLGDTISQYLLHDIWKYCRYYCRYCEVDNVNTVSICITISRDTVFGDDSIS